MSPPLAAKVLLGLTPLLALAAACESTLHIGKVLGDNGGTGNSGVPGADSGSGGSGMTGGPDGGGALPDGAPSMPPGHPLPAAHAPLTSTSKLDLLFLIDDSSSMTPLQQKMRLRLANFMDVLKGLPGGLPDIHVAVVSSSLGAGIYGSVPGCSPGTSGNLNGAFQHSPACTALHAGQSFISSTRDATGARVSNFDGDITSVFSCIADLGDRGCGFEQQFEATRIALQRSQTVGDENQGFLRDDAYLGIVMLTNEDDCSAPENSTLFDPAQGSVADPLGGLQSYRCNEFGHLCNGVAPPHNAPGMPQTLTGCVSNENGPLTSVGGFVDFLFGLKPMHPERLFVAAIAGPPTPYVVGSHTSQLPTGATEPQPFVQHSCSAVMPGTEYADPGVRVTELTKAFGPNSFFGSICADDFGPTMQSIAQTMVAP